MQVSLPLYPVIVVLHGGDGDTDYFTCPSPPPSFCSDGQFELPLRAAAGPAAHISRVLSNVAL